MAARRRSDEDQTGKIKEEVGPRHGIVSTYRARHGRIMMAQSLFNESDGLDFS